jgi:TolB-like protein/lipoprotein NlpI
MASLIQGFEYDIFLSYRQKDNKGDRWVSDFVEALKSELDKNFKEEISVYFDVNPHDGLLGTHDVDASLKEKLKCLIFIPVISRTYCDLRSFAWEHEFKAFVNSAAHDRFGLRIRLPDGNVASRVLPVIIHDLEIPDIKMCESVLGGNLRGVEFIYKEPGVNRPMTNLDPEEKNLNGTKYRNQVNRVANAIREIISGLKSQYTETRALPSDVLPEAQSSQPLQEKSIIVLPFENISSDADQEYFSDGLTEEVISDLSHVPDLLVISRSSAMTFKGTRKTIREIAGAVKVRYVLEGSVRKSTDSIRITAQLIDSVSDSHLWSEKYTGKLEDVFDIQEKVSRSIVGALKIKLNSKEQKKLHERRIDNVFAYDCYKRAYPEIVSFNSERISKGLSYLQKGLDIAGENALIYAGMAFAYFQYVNAGIDQEKNLRNSEVFVRKAFNLDSELPEAHAVLGCIYSLSGEPAKGMEHILKAYSGKPEDPEILTWLALGYSLIGRTDCGKSVIRKSLRIDPVNPMNDSVIGWNHFYSGRFDLAFDPLLTAYSYAPGSGMNQFWKALILFYCGRNEEADEFISRTVEEPPKDSWTHLSVLLKYVIKGQKDRLHSLMDPQFAGIHRLDPQNSYLIGALYSYLGKKKKSLEWLENAVSRGFNNYPFMNRHDFLLNGIRDEERFKKLLKKVKRRWESFEVFCNIDFEKSGYSSVPVTESA